MSGTVRGYRLARGTTVQELEHEVYELMKQSYEPFGSPIFDRAPLPTYAGLQVSAKAVFLQAMVLRGGGGPIAPPAPTAKTQSES